MDNDGKTALSNIITLENASIKSLKVVSKIMVYPNPATAILTIENAKGERVEIVNVLGEVVLSVLKSADLEN